MSDAPPRLLDGPGFARTGEVLELGEELLDRVEVGAVGRQEQKMSAGSPDGGAGGLVLVAAEVVQDDDIARLQGRDEDGLDIAAEDGAIDRPVDDPRRADPVVAQRGDEGERAPVAMRGLGLQALPARSPAPQRRHVGLDPGLVEKDQPARIDLRLMLLPASPSTRDVRPVLLTRPQRFFEAQPLRPHEHPDRPPVRPHPARPVPPPSPAG